MNEHDSSSGDPAETTLPPNAVFTKTDSICNICLKDDAWRRAIGIREELTLEHSPPKKCLRKNDLKLKVFPRLDPLMRPQYTQSGVRHATTCTTCNNGLSGDDNVLRHFCKRIEALWGALKRQRRARRGDSQPPTIPCNPRRILRSVYGHALAANKHTPRGGIYEEMREFVMYRNPGPGKIPPVHYFIHQDNFVNMDPGTLYWIGGQLVPVATLKWWPIAFIISPEWRLDAWDEGFLLPRINDFFNVGPEDVLIPIFARPDRWYEDLTEGVDSTFITSGFQETAIKGYPQRPDKK